MHSVYKRTIETLEEIIAENAGTGFRKEVLSFVQSLAKCCLTSIGNIPFQFGKQFSVVIFNNRHSKSTPFFYISH